MKRNTIPPLTIEISPGELFDRASILVLKERAVAGTSKRTRIRAERATLRAYVKSLKSTYPEIKPLVRSLARINKKLWDAEDRIRMLSARGDLGKRFVTTASLIHILNDERAKLKRAITHTCGGTHREEKIYRVK